MDFLKEIEFFRKNMRGKTIRRDGETWLYGGSFTHQDLLVLTFYIPSNKSNKEGLQRHVFMHTLRAWVDSGSVEFVPIPEDNEEQIDKLISGLE